MSGMKNTVYRFANASMGRGYKTRDEINAANEANTQKKKDRIYKGATMPDEELIRRNERRKAAKRRGSRVNTVLTDRETLG